MSDSIFNLTSILSTLGGISVISGIWLKLRRLIQLKSEQKSLEKAIILQEAKEISNRHKALLEEKIKHLETELTSKIESIHLKMESLESSLTKDIEHVKDSYNNELKFLGSKIEELKDELRSSLNQVVTLVSKLIDKT